jgi:hypothetical protein
MLLDLPSIPILSHHSLVRRNFIMKKNNIKIFLQDHKNSFDEVVNPQVYYERIRINIKTAK